MKTEHNWISTQEREKYTNMKDEAPCKCALKSMVIHEGMHVQARVRERERERRPAVWQHRTESNSKNEEKKENR